MRDSKLLGVLLVISGASNALANTIHINSQDWVDIGNMDKYKAVPVSGTLPAAKPTAATKKDEKKPALSAVKQGEIYNIKGTEKSQSAASKKDKKSETAKGGAGEKAMDKRSILSNTEGLLEEGKSLTKVKTDAGQLKVGVPNTFLGSNGRALNPATLANSPGERVRVCSPAGNCYSGVVQDAATTNGLVTTSTAAADPTITLPQIRGGSRAGLFAIRWDDIPGVTQGVPYPSLRALGQRDSIYYAYTNATARRLGGPFGLDAGYQIVVYGPRGEPLSGGGGEGGGTPPAGRGQPR